MSDLPTMHSQVIDDYQRHGFVDRRFVEAPGGITEMKCGCGGFLQVVALVPRVSQPPRHRTRRISKKWEKRWRRAQGALLSIETLLAFSRTPHFRCVACGQRASFYRAMGRNLITVQPLPDGAFPIVG